MHLEIRPLILILFESFLKQSVEEMHLQIRSLIRGLFDAFLKQSLAVAEQLVVLVWQVGLLFAQAEHLMLVPALLATPLFAIADAFKCYWICFLSFHRLSLWNHCRDSWHRLSLRCIFPNI
jgi:hypothetical protein